MLAALLAAFGNAIEVTHSKRVMDVFHMSSKTFNALGSVLTFFIMCFVAAVFGRDPITGNLDAAHLALFGGVLLVAFFYNYLYYYALKRGDLCDVEPLAMMYPLITMVIAIIVFPDERNYLIVVPGLIAAVTLITSRVRKHHFKMRKATAAMLGFAILMAIEANLLRPLLEVVSPFVLYTVRIGILSVLFMTVSRPNLRKINKKTFWNTALVSLIVSIEFPAYYFAIRSVGVVETSLVMLLAPVLILFASKFLFKEKLTFRKAFSSAVILVCIAAAIIIS